VSRDECPRELEMTRAALARRLRCRPDDGDLLAHADTCAVCRDAATLAIAFAECREEAMREARVPAAGQVWWRSALRAHADAGRAARRPLVWLLGIAAACAAGVALGLVQLAGPQLYETVQGLFAAASLLGGRAADFIDGVRPALAFVALLLGCLALAPVVVYLALSDGQSD
jgi:hypothetical protein